MSISPFAARLARDLAIECMARLDHSVFVVRESAAEPFFKEYRRAAGRSMAEFVTIINRAALVDPELKPSDQEWAEVLRVRRPETEEHPDLVPEAQVARAHALVEARLREIRNVAPELEENQRTTDTALQGSHDLLRRWVPRPG